MDTSKNIYKQKFEKYGISPKSLLWKNKGAAHQRFRQFWAEIDFTGKTVLDIGCGFGEFGKFLLKRYVGVKYTGIDKMAEFIEAAKKAVPDGNFEVMDYMAIPPSQGFGEAKYDVVIASGVLNSNIGLRPVASRRIAPTARSGPMARREVTNLEYRKKAIKTMFALTKDVFAFNMTGGHPAPINTKESNIWYADSLQILDYCLTLTRRVILRHHYNSKDFTIVMKKIHPHTKGAQGLANYKERSDQ